MKNVKNILVTMKVKSLVAAAVLPALCLLSMYSCSKEGAAGAGSDGGGRVISVAFGNTGKSALDSDGVTPKFVSGDRIRVANGTDAPEVCTVSVDDNGDATFTTTLTGTLTAVYPASATKLNGNAIEGVRVSARQDGTFASANIAMATDIETSAVFNSRTALFEITPPAGVKTFTITSLQPVGYRQNREGTAAPINTGGTTDADRLVINVTDVPSGGKAFVSLVPGVKLTDLSFDAGETYGMKGIPVSKLGTNPDATVANMIYSIDASNWHPYVIIGGLKWATMNVGATSEADCGYHFAWGHTAGCVWNGTSWVLASDNTTVKKFDATDSDFPQLLWDNFKDAALANWGGAWRMFKSEDNGESVSLTNACRTDSSTGDFAPTTISSVPEAKGVYFYNVTGSKGLYCVNGEGKKLFFPVGGYGKDGSKNEESQGWYWSSIAIDKSGSYEWWANDFIFSENSVIPLANNTRGCGLLIRPVAN